MAAGCDGRPGNWDRTSGGLAAEAERAIIAATPAGRAGRPDDIAAAVRYLASPDADFVTGHVLSVNGGRRFAA